jgi:hypothetical protein
MKRIFYGISGRTISLAILLTLALTFLFGGVASAAPVVASQQSASDATVCLSATPPSQVVGVRETAWVKVAVDCPPITTATYIQVKWGDGTIEDYPLTGCQQICPILPITVATSHAYTSTGDYTPVFCLIPSPSSSSVDCTTAQIKVVILDPPVS